MKKNKKNGSSFRQTVGSEITESNKFQRAAPDWQFTIPSIDVSEEYLRSEYLDFLVEKMLPGADAGNGNFLDDTLAEEARAEIKSLKDRYDRNRELIVDFFCRRSSDLQAFKRESNQLSKEADKLEQRKAYLEGKINSMRSSK